MKVNIERTIDLQKAEEFDISLFAFKVYEYLYWEYLPLAYELGIVLDDEQGKLMHQFRCSKEKFDNALKELYDKKFLRYYKGKIVLRGDTEALALQQKGKKK